VRIRLRRQSTRVTNPVTEASLAVRVVSGDPEQPRPAVILVPGALLAGGDYFSPTGITDRFARAGYAAIDFDADGRGDSGGTEDCNGPAQRAGLATIVQYASTLPVVDPARIVLVSFDYGLALAAGVLASYPGLPVSLLVDWEGPARQEQIKRLAPFRNRHIDDPRGEDAWWQEREPAALLGRIEVPYQRVQSDPDHAHVAVDHAFELIRLTTSGEYGGQGRSPWTRLNGNPPNRVFGEGRRASFLPAVPAEIAVLPYLLELVPPEGRLRLP
jgi:hypothetical protein